RLLADDLQHRPPRHDEAAVEMADDSVCESQRPREDDIDAARPDYLFAPSALRLARDQAEAADAVATDVHQRPAVESRVEASVARTALGRDVEGKRGAEYSQH